MSVSQANDQIKGAMKTVGATMLESWQKAATPEQSKIIADYKAM